MPPKSSEPNQNCQTEEFDEEHELILIELQEGRLVDRYGHRHSEAIFRNWSPAAIRVLGIRREPEGGAA